MLRTQGTFASALDQYHRLGSKVAAYVFIEDLGDFGNSFRVCSGDCDMCVFGAIDLEGMSQLLAGYGGIKVRHGHIGTVPPRMLPRPYSRL